MNASPRVAVLGLGKMGQAIVTGLLRGGAMRADDIVATERTRAGAEKHGAEVGVRCLTDNVDAVRDADVVLVCVKPKDVDKALSVLAARGALSHAPLVVCIAAGISTAHLDALIGGVAPIVRAMPNTPCFIGKGMTVLSRGPRATDDHVALARRLFEPLGRVSELEERHMDTVTGLTASGPAFIYLIIEALADGGVMRGLPRDVATELVAQMTLGAGEMVLATGRHPAALKDDVTTPAGCTIAGILALEDGRIRSVLARAVETTAKVAGELGK